MGLFDKMKAKVQEKASEVHICVHCKKEFSGLFNGVKLYDGNYVCMDCYPKETKLMKQKGVCDKFSISQLDQAGINKYITYREREQLRAARFTPTATWLDNNLLSDNEHGYFKLKNYDEVFITQQIKCVMVKAGYQDGKFIVACGLIMNNWVYKMLPIQFTFKSKAFLKANQMKEYYSHMEAFHQSFCPHAEFMLERF